MVGTTPRWARRGRGELPRRSTGAPECSPAYLPLVVLPGDITANVLAAAFVSFRRTFIIDADGARLTPDSTPCFPTRHEVAASLAAAGYARGPTPPRCRPTHSSA